MRTLIFTLAVAMLPSVAIAAMACDRCTASTAGQRCYRMQASGPVYHQCPPAPAPQADRGNK